MTGSSDADAGGDGHEGEADLFGKLYTYDELLALAPPARPKPKTRPDHWPEDTTPDPGNWIFWLPDDWGQGIKTTSGGKFLKCYIDPKGKRFFHKPDIEKYLGRKLAAREPKEDEEGAGRSVHDAVPKWPDWGLPKDWRIGFRKLPTSLHKIYVPPGQDEGFLYHRHLVERWLAGETRELTAFGTSRPTAAPSDAGQAAKKRKVKPAATDAFFPLALPAAQTATPPVAWAEPETPELAREAFGHFQELLVRRGFKEDVELLAVHGRASGSCYARRIRGIYYRMPAEFTDRPCYQKLRCQSVSSLGCERVYIIWNPSKTRWQIGTALNHEAPIYAYCTASSGSEHAPLAFLPGPWMVCDGSDGDANFKECDDLHILPRGPPV